MCNILSVILFIGWIVNRPQDIYRGNRANSALHMIMNIQVLSHRMQAGKTSQTANYIHNNLPPADSEDSLERSIVNIFSLYWTYVKITTIFFKHVQRNACCLRSQGWPPPTESANATTRLTHILIIL